MNVEAVSFKKFYKNKENIYKNESPWGSDPRGGGGNDGNGSSRRRPPPNIDDLIRKAQGSVGKIFPGGRGGNKPIIIGLVVLIVLWALSGLYRVLPDEQGVVLRFGTVSYTHLTLPTKRIV